MTLRELATKSTYSASAVLGLTTAIVATRTVRKMRRNRHILAMPVDIAKDPINVLRAEIVLAVARNLKSSVGKERDLWDTILNGGT